MCIYVPYCAADSADSKEPEELGGKSDDSDDSDDMPLGPDSKDAFKGPACLFLSFCERTLLGIFASAY